MGLHWLRSAAGTPGGEGTRFCQSEPPCLFRHQRPSPFGQTHAEGRTRGQGLEGTLGIEQAEALSKGVSVDYAQR